MDTEDVRPRSVGEVVDAGIALYRNHFLAATGIAAIFVVPTALVQLWNVRNTAASGLGDLLVNTFELAATAESPPFSGVNFAIDLLSTLLALSATIALFVSTYRGKQAGVASALSSLGRRLVPTLIFGFVFLVGGLVGLILAIFPGVWLMTSWSLALPAIFDQRLGARAAMNRSLAMVRGRFFTVVAILALAFLIQAALTYIGILATLAAEWLTSLSASFLITDALVNAIASLFGLPLIGAVLTAEYFDARTRREGLDIALAVEALHTGAQHAGRGEEDPDLFGLGTP